MDWGEIGKPLYQAELCVGLWKWWEVWNVQWRQEHSRRNRTEPLEFDLDQRSQMPVPEPCSASLQLEAKLIIISLRKIHQGGRAISSSDCGILWLFAQFLDHVSQEQAGKRSPPFWEHVGKANTRI